MKRSKSYDVSLLRDVSVSVRRIALLSNRDISDLQSERKRQREREMRMVNSHFLPSEKEKKKRRRRKVAAISLSLVDRCSRPPGPRSVLTHD